MFTGIVEEVGEIKKINQDNECLTLSIEANDILTNAHVGDSVSVNGVCLTVTSFSVSTFTVDITPETKEATNLGNLSEGLQVNLERSMPADGRFDGHLVSGHVDGTGTIIDKTFKENAVYYRIQLPQNLLRYMIMKGSVAIDGISLTVFGITDRSFTISLIPHTLEKTNLVLKETGDIVNIECDMVGKYIEKLLNLHERENNYV